MFHTPHLIQLAIQGMRVYLPGQASQPSEHRCTCAKERLRAAFAREPELGRLGEMFVRQVIFLLSTTPFFSLILHAFIRHRSPSWHFA